MQMKFRLPPRPYNITVGGTWGGRGGSTYTRVWIPQSCIIHYTAVGRAATRGPFAAAATTDGPQFAKGYSGGVVSNVFSEPLGIRRVAHIYTPPRRAVMTNEIHYLGCGVDSAAPKEFITPASFPPRDQYRAATSVG